VIFTTLYLEAHYDLSIYRIRKKVVIDTLFVKKRLNDGYFALVSTSADSVPSSYLVRITIAPIGTTFGNLQ
jgi:hypothetical protein